MATIKLTNANPSNSNVAEVTLLEFSTNKWKDFAPAVPRIIEFVLLQCNVYTKRTWQHGYLADFLVDFLESLQRYFSFPVQFKRCELKAYYNKQLRRPFKTQCNLQFSKFLFQQKRKLRTSSRWFVQYINEICSPELNRISKNKPSRRTLLQDGTQAFCNGRLNNETTK